VNDPAWAWGRATPSSSSGFGDSPIFETNETVTESLLTPELGAVEVEGTDSRGDVKPLTTPVVRSAYCNDQCEHGETVDCPAGTDKAGLPSYVCIPVPLYAPDTGEYCEPLQWFWIGGCDEDDDSGSVSSTRYAQARRWKGRVKRAPNGNTLYAQTNADGKWGAWINLGGQTTNYPHLTAGRSGLLEIYLRGTDGHVYRRTQTSAAASSWGSWEDLGGNIKGSPTVLKNKSGTLEVWVRGTDNRIYSKLQSTRGQWGGWYARGGNVISQPQLALGYLQKLELHVTGSDRHAWFLKQSTPGSWDSTWRDLGGNHTVQSPTRAGNRLGVIEYNLNGDVKRRRARPGKC
jgi:hypothetical protein